MSNYLINSIREHAQTEGVPSRMVCPKCLGGSEHEECMTLFLTHDSKAVLATCHRALCEIGTVNINASNISGDPGARATPPWRRVLVAAVPWPSNIGTPCKYLFELTSIRKYMLYDKEFDRLVLPVYDEIREVRGVVGKRLGGDGPKSIYLADPDYYGLSWYIRTAVGYQGVVVLVEDGLSAIALCENGIDAIALNGTGLNDNKVTAITGQYDTIYLALDADATRVAIRLANRYRGVANIIVRRLQHDIKDMSNDEVREWVKEIQA